jgi:ABC-type uncharacterized transport system substrate-binding protein
MKLYRLLICLCLFMTLPRSINAHPHAFIDLAVDVLFDKNGAVIGLKEVWLFDEFYTAYAIESADKVKKGAPPQEKLVELLNINLRNLAKFDYFTKVRVGQTPIALGTATEASSRMFGARLEMTFTLPFKAPVEMGDKPVVYSIYDPTYYIEMLHADIKEVIRLIDAPAGCKHALFKPDPNPEMVALAAGLDRNKSAGDTLGAIFADEVLIECTHSK